MFLTGLDRVLNDSGVPWSARPGWRTRTAHRGGLREVRAVMWHTTETVTSAFRNSAAPTLGYVTSRAGQDWPLYNILIDRTGHAYLIAAGTAAHAGKGSGHGMPRDQANYYSFGISFDSNNNTTPVNAAQLETGARIGAAIDREWKNSIHHVMHGEWAPARRSDPTKIPGGWTALRAAINRGHWNTPTNTTGRTWLEMVSKSELQSLLRQEGWAYKGRDETRDAYSYLRNTHRMVAAAAGERAGLLEAIRQVAGGAEIDLGAIEKAAEKGVSDALASLEADVTLTINTDQED